MRSFIGPLLSATLVGMFTVHCSKGVNAVSKDDSSKTVSVAFSIRTNPEFNHVAKSAVLTVSGADMDSIKQPMTINDSALYTTVHGVPMGQTRLFEIFVYDSAHMIRYYGSQSTDIDPLVVTRVAIKLHKPVSGDVIVEGEIADDSGSVVAPSKPYIVTTIPGAPDSGKYYFAVGMGTDTLVTGASFDYEVMFLRYTYAGWSKFDTIYCRRPVVSEYLPYPGTYRVLARVRSTFNPSVVSAWSEPLLVKALSQSRIIEVTSIDTFVIDTVHRDSVKRDSVYQDSVWRDSTYRDTVWRDTVHRDTIHRDTLWRDSFYRDSMLFIDTIRYRVD